MVAQTKLRASKEKLVQTISELLVNHLIFVSTMIHILVCNQEHVPQKIVSYHYIYNDHASMGSLPLNACVCPESIL